VQVRLSRVDDNAKGSDIDLYVEAEDDNQQLEHRLDYLYRLSKVLGEQRVDLVIHQRGKPLSPIHRIARKTGVKLC
jgi:predicted nucleotidyltransferase